MPIRYEWVQMELRHLRYFQAVAEELSFSKAALRLGIAQPAVSRAIRDLELELGVELLDRSSRKVRRTSAGDVLLRDGATVLEQLEKALARTRRAAAGDEGELRLGYIGPPTRAFLPEVLRAFRNQLPRIHLVLEERTPERVWEMVAKGRLSVGLTRPVKSADAGRLRSEVLLEEEFCAAVPMDHPWARRTQVRWKDLAGQPLIVLARREGAGSHVAVVQACLEAGFDPRLAHTPSLIGTILEYVKAGGGIGVVPESATDTDLKLLPLRPRKTLPLVMVTEAVTNDHVVEVFQELVRAITKRRAISKIQGEGL